MNDLSSDKYLDMSHVPLAEYSIEIFLHKDLTVEKRVDITQLTSAVAGMLALLKFDIRLLGFKYLTLLVTRYIVKSDYDENASLEAIAKGSGTSPNVVLDNILSSIKRNKNLAATVSKIFNRYISSSELSLQNVLEIVGAVFKIYYNYSTDDETFDYESNAAIDFNKMVFNRGNK